MGGQVSTQPTQASPASPAANRPQVRASDADRDGTAGLLSAAFAEGRLTADEHEQRLNATYAARTWQQLRQLTADLPVPPGAATERTAVPGMFGEPDLCLLCVLLIVCPPAGIAWWLLSRRRPPAPRAGGLG
jgi:hypothetical protein